MTFKGIDLTGVLTAVLGLVGMLISWAAVKVKNAATAAEDANKTQKALAQVGVLATTLLGRAWDKLAPQIQAAIADGKVTPEERAALEKAVGDVIKSFASEDTLSSLASALGLPLPGLIAKIASMMLDTFTKAHDPDVLTVSNGAFPVAEFEESHGG